MKEQVEMPPPPSADVTLKNPDVARINTAIMQLMARTSPPSRAVTMLYDRWVRFTASPYYVALSDTQLFPIYQAFATTYAIIARAQGMEPADVDPRLLVLATGDLNQGIERAGRALDATLNGAAHVTGKVTSAMWKPALLIAGVALAVGWAKRGRRGR